MIKTDTAVYHTIGSHNQRFNLRNPLWMGSAKDNGRASRARNPRASGYPWIGPFGYICTASMHQALSPCILRSGDPLHFCGPTDSTTVCHLTAPSAPSTVNSSRRHPPRFARYRLHCAPSLAANSAWPAHLSVWLQAKVSAAERPVRPAVFHFCPWS